VKSADFERMATGISRLRWELMVRRNEEVPGLATGAQSNPQALALHAVVMHGPLRMGALADALRVSVPTASRTVDALVEDGLVTRAADPSDARAVQVALTARGRRVHVSRQRRFAQALERLMQELSEGERRELADALEIVNRLLVERSG
jgi:DNA-binding MarR family transcriptional regulator